MASSHDSQSAQAGRGGNGEVPGRTLDGETGSLGQNFFEDLHVILIDGDSLDSFVHFAGVRNLDDVLGTSFQ